jgi:hypothetical protein
MRPARQSICAVAVALLAVAGCNKSGFLQANFFQQSGPDRVVAGSLESVTGSTQHSLQELGIAVVAQPDGQSMRLKCRTKTGVEFSVVLTSANNGQAQQTHVRIEWEKGRDDQTGSMILGQLDVKSQSAQTMQK